VFFEKNWYTMLGVFLDSEVLSLFIVEKILSLFQGNNWMIIPAAFLSVVLHEISHGYAAYAMGDPTAKANGRLSLNPLHHLDVIGLISMILFRFGWAKPVPVNPYYFKRRKLGMALVSLAGPISNLILAFVGITIVYLLTLIPVGSEFLFIILQGLVDFFIIFAILNIGLAVFNLIPIPPLDGSKILFSLLPNRTYLKLLQVEQYGFLILIVLLNIPFFESVISQIRDWIYSSMVGIYF